MIFFFNQPTFWLNSRALTRRDGHYYEHPGGSQWGILRKRPEKFWPSDLKKIGQK